MGRHITTVLSIPSSGATGAHQGNGTPAGDPTPESLPKLREVREAVFCRAEYHYLSNLVNLTGRNIRKACELSGLSRSRLYALLKKYRIDDPAREQHARH